MSIHTEAIIYNTLVRVKELKIADEANKREAMPKRADDVRY